MTWIFCPDKALAERLKQCAVDEQAVEDGHIRYGYIVKEALERELDRRAKANELVSQAFLRDEIGGK